ncbi:MAG: FxsA family protein [Actinobacteria bacterium]|nr:FxsA family protein [Actinomycetota bacterium]
MRGFLVFLVYLIIEISVAIWLASMIGWLLVIGLTIAGFVLGVIVIQNAGLRAAQSLRQASEHQQQADGAEVGDSGIKFVAGTLIGTPGFVTDALGLILLIPPIRKLARKGAALWFVRWARGKNMSVVKTTVDGATVTRVVPGDVVVGDVINRQDASTDSPAPTSPDGSTSSDDPRGEIPGSPDAEKPH